MGFPRHKGRRTKKCKKGDVSGPCIGQSFTAKKYDDLVPYVAYKFRFTTTPPPLRLSPEEWKQILGPAAYPPEKGGNMSTNKPNYFLLTIGFIIAALTWVLFIPGLDVAAWHFLHPVTFWQRFGLIAVELFTFWPRFLFGGFLGGTIAAFTAVISK